MSALPEEIAKPIRLDLGCGKNKRKDGDWLGVDTRPFSGVDYVWNLANTPWRLVNIEYQDTKERVDGDGAAITIGLADEKYAQKEWPIIEESSIEEVHCSHFLEHLTALERIRFVNELYRVLKPGCKATIITPHWASCRAYGDLTHQWPPVSEFWWYYLSKPWRADNAPHNEGYTCDFEAVWGYGMRPDVAVRPPDFQQFAMANYKEAITDMQCTLTKK